MFSTETTAVLRAVLEEVCEAASGNGIRAHVASKLLEAAAEGQTKIEDLRKAGREALNTAPTMAAR
jgi:hypothetical protein